MLDLTFMDCGDSGACAFLGPSCFNSLVHRQLVPLSGVAVAILMACARRSRRALHVLLLVLSWQLAEKQTRDLRSVCGPEACSLREEMERVPVRSAASVTMDAEAVHETFYGPHYESRCGLLGSGRLLTVHLLTPHVAREFKRNFPSMERNYYSRQESHAVLLAVPSQWSTVEILSRALGGRTPRRHHGDHYEYSSPASGTKLVGRAVDAALPRRLPLDARGRPITNATCGALSAQGQPGRWPWQYALFNGAWFTHHLLRLEELPCFTFYVKVDTDVGFIAPMPDLGKILASADGVNMAHAGLIVSGGDAPNSCERGIVAALRRYARRQQSPVPRSLGRRSPFARACLSPCSQTPLLQPFGNFLVFRTSFMTSARVKSLARYLYEHDWSGYFESRWTDQGGYLAFAYYGMRNMTRRFSGPEILDLAYLRDTRFVHGDLQKHREAGCRDEPSRWYLVLVALVAVISGIATFMLGLGRSTH